MRIELVERTPEEKAFEKLAAEFDAYMEKMPEMFDFDGFDKWQAEKPASVAAFSAALAGQLPMGILVPLAGL